MSSSSSTSASALGAVTRSGICAACSSVVPYTAHRAAIAGHLDCLKVCVRRGCKLISRNGDTLLHVASKHGQLECLGWLLENCPSLRVSDINSKRNTVLHCALDGGDIETVKVLFARISGRKEPLVSETVVNALHLPNDAGMTPLLVAVMMDQVDLVDWLFNVFKAGIPGAVNNQAGGATAYHYAAAIGSVEMLRVLYRHMPKLAGLGVPLTGKLPIHLAVHTGHLEAAQFLNSVTDNALLSRSAEGMSCFHQVVQSGHLHCLRWMAEEFKASGQDATAFISAVDNEKASLFHFAAAFGETKCMQFLLESAADKSFAVNARDVWGRTPLHDAAEKNHLNCMKLLLAAGADIYALDLNEQTPYTLAMKHSKLRAFITTNMSSEACQQQQQQVIPDQPPRKTSSSSHEEPALFRRGQDHRTSVRYKAAAPSADFLPPTRARSTTGPEHTYSAVVVSTSEDDVRLTPDCQSYPDTFHRDSASSDSSSALPSPVNDTATPLAVAASAPVDVSLSTSDGLVPPQPRSRSASTGDVGVTAPVGALQPPSPSTQPKIKILHAHSAESRISHEVRKLSFAMEMFNVSVEIVRLKKDALAKVNGAADLLEWLETKKAFCDYMCVVCTPQLLALFDAALEGKKAKTSKSKKSASTSSEEKLPPRSMSLTQHLLERTVSVVTMHGSSSRYRPAWLMSCPYFYWPKQQPSLFRKLSITVPDHQLSVPTHRKRAGSV